MLLAYITFCSLNLNAGEEMQIKNKINTTQKSHSLQSIFGKKVIKIVFICLKVKWILSGKDHLTGARECLFSVRWRCFIILEWNLFFCFEKKFENKLKVRVKTYQEAIKLLNSKTSCLFLLNICTYLLRNLRISSGANDVCLNQAWISLSEQS